MLEQKEMIAPELLQQIADVLKVPAEAIKNFDEEVAISYINTFNDNSVSHVIGNYGTYNFNPVEKWVEAIEDNKRLYEALLKSDGKRIELLEELLANERKK